MAYRDPRMRPGMRPRMRSRSIRNIWCIDSHTPFLSDYQIGQEITMSGQFGKSYRCKRKKDKRIFAVKLIRKAQFYRLDRSPQRRQALLIAMQGEIDIMRRLKHKYIISMEACYHDKHKLYIVMEECKGDTLFDRITQKQQPYNERYVSSIIRMILEALFYLHEYHRVVHCDLTPNNIYFENKCQDSPIKVMDFGMSKVLPRLVSMGNLYNHSIYYTAPEIIKGDYSHKCDMWSLGVIMFVMLFNYPPFYVHPTNCTLLISGYIRLSKIIVPDELISLIVMFHPNRFDIERQRMYRLILNGFEGKVRRGYGPWFPKEIAVSDEAKDLMTRLMDSDISKRLTAKEALHHPWIVNGDTNTNKWRYPSQRASFSAFNEFPYITELFNDKYKQLKPRHFKKLRKIWRQLDVDGIGSIDCEEFKNGLLKLTDLYWNENDLDQAMQKIDGKMNYECIMNAMVHDYLIESDQILYEAFCEMDDDEDGKIKTLQLKEKIKKLNVYENVDELIKIIDFVDVDKNGIIDYEEYLRALHKDFNETPKWFWD